jgi:phosphate transport system substrate-binding protein
MTMLPGRLRLIAASIGLILIAAACSSSDAKTNSGGSSVSGKIAVSGSSTVLPISSRVAELFKQQNPNVSLSVDGPGTTDGFVLFCKGQTDINDASRPIDLAAEAPVCKKNGVNYYELKIGIDGITVMTNPADGSVTCLDFKDLYALLGPESNGFKNWSDANALGQKIGAGHTPYPNQPLTITGPGQESGTWGSFIDFVIKPIAEERGLPDDKMVTRSDYQTAANDNVIIQGIEGAPSSLGWVGYAYYTENKSQIKAISIDNGDGKCVAPTDQSIASKTYPLSRDLYLYVNAAKVKSNAALKKFVSFYLSTQGLSSVHEVGYIDQPANVIQQTKQVWTSQQTGTHQS